MVRSHVCVVSTTSSILYSTSFFFFVSAQNQVYEYYGCFTADWDRSQTADVPITSNGVQTCRNYCATANYDYFGFECPHDNGDEVHCECANSISNPSDKADDVHCQEFNDSGDHCSGPFSISGILGIYYMGAAFFNTAYSTRGK